MFIPISLLAGYGLSVFSCLCFPGAWLKVTGSGSLSEMIAKQEKDREEVMAASGRGTARASLSIVQSSLLPLVQIEEL